MLGFSRSMTAALIHRFEHAVARHAAREGPVPVPQVEAPSDINDLIAGSS